MKSKILFPLTLLALGCGSTNNSSPFSGNWSCTGQTTLSFQIPARLAAENVTSSSTLSISAGEDLPITLVSGDAGAGCVVTYDTSGGTATLPPNQSCTLVTPSATVTATFTTGSATVNGSTMATTTAFSFTGTVV